MGDIVAVMGSKGGVGKTTVAVAFAAWRAESGASVLVVDTDSNRSASRFLTDAQIPGVEVVCLDDPDAVLEQVPSLAERFESIVIDGAGGLDELSRAALLRCDVAILPSGAGALDLRGLERSARLVRQAQSVRSGPPRAVAVLNRVRLGTVLAREALEVAGSFGVPVAANVLADRVALADAFGQGVSPFTFPPARESAAELRRLFVELFPESQP